MSVLLTAVRISETNLSVDLSDGRTVTLDISIYPRLEAATSHERDHWRLVGKGEGIFWPLLDEQISVDDILKGKPSGESQRSFQEWLKTHRQW